MSEAGGGLRIAKAIVDLNAVAYNIRRLKAMAGGRRKIMMVVKANAYGHGVVPVAKVGLEQGVDMLAVATPLEGVELREAGIGLPTLVLGCVLQKDITVSLDNGLSLTVASVSLARAISRRTVMKEQVASVHIAVDTGMGTVGFKPSEVVKAVRRISEMKGLRIEGTYTHFSSAEIEHDEFTLNQTRTFRGVLDALKKDNLPCGIAHAANTAAVINYPEAHLDMIRPGLGIYGMLPDEPLIGKVELKPALTFLTRVSFVKRVPAGYPLSYNHTYVTPRPTTVATVAAGYGDGYSRALSDKGLVLVRGKRVPVLGRVCMDQVLVDVTGIDGVRVGGEVILIGRQQDEEIRAEEVAAQAGTIPYEITCMIGSRVCREYVR